MILSQQGSRYIQVFFFLIFMGWLTAGCGICAMDVSHMANGAQATNDTSLHEDQSQSPIISFWEYWMNVLIYQFNQHPNDEDIHRELIHIRMDAAELYALLVNQVTGNVSHQIGQLSLIIHTIDYVESLSAERQDVKEFLPSTLIQSQ